MKRGALAVLKSFGLLAGVRMLQRHRLLVLTYHGVLPGDDRDDFLNHNFVTEEMFDRQLRYLRRHYRPLSVGELIRCRKRNIPPPLRSVAITFDDGFENNYSVAFPLLRTHSFPFTVFLSTGFIGDPDGQLWSERVKRAIYFHDAGPVTLEVVGQRFSWDAATPPRRAAAARRVLQVLKRQPVPVRDRAVEIIEGTLGRPPLSPEERNRFAFLEWDQVREMASAGVEFGSHTVHHPILSTLDDISLDRELTQSRQKIEAEIGSTCDAFAYPNGSSLDFGPREKRALQRAGYTVAFSLNGRLNPHPYDPFEIDRVNIGRPFDLATFEAASTGVLLAGRELRNRVYGTARAHGGGTS